jgi:YHS domain-containing protein
MKTKDFLISGLAASALFFTACQKEETTMNDASATATAMAESSEDYPFETCVVSGEKLGSMGEPHVITHEGTEVQFCCDNCVPKFKEKPAEYITKIEAAQ